MKYVIVCVADQTVAFHVRNNCWTIEHPKAALHDTEKESIESVPSSQGTYDKDFWIEEVENAEEFRARPPTWGV